MNYSPKCCVSGCSNTWELTKDNISYYRFPNDKKIKQKWLDSINWSDGKPGCNHFVCANHFEDNALDNIVSNTTIVPKIFTPEFVAVKTEFDLLDSEPHSLSYDSMLNGREIKTEDDDDFELESSNNENRNTTESIDNELDDDIDDKEFYQIIDVIDDSDNESTVSMTANTKIEYNSYGETNESTLTETIHDNNSTQSIDEWFVPKKIKVDLSEAKSKGVSVLSVGDIKVEGIQSDCQSDYTLESETGQPRSNIDLLEANTNSILFLHSREQQKRYDWTEEGTREFLKCLLKYKNEFLNLRKRKKIKFWQKIESCLKEQGVMKPIPGAEQLNSKWKNLVKIYQTLLSDLEGSKVFPFMSEMTEILYDSLKPHNNSTSIELDEPCQPINCSSVISSGSATPNEPDKVKMLSVSANDTSNIATKNNLKSYEKKNIVKQIDRPPYNSQNVLESNMLQSKMSVEDLKKLYWQKKIEGRTLKNELLMQLLNEHNSNISKNGNSGKSRPVEKN